MKKKKAEALSGSGCLIHPAMREFLGYALAKLAFRVRSRMEELLAAHGVVAPQCGMLKLLHELGPLHQKELGQHMLMDKATMVRMADHLEDLGLAQRKSDASDRRARFLSITPKGVRLLEHVKSARSEAEGMLLKNLDRAERAEFKRLVRKLAVDE